MGITLRKYIMNGIAEDAENLKIATNSDSWPHGDGELLNWQYVRTATPEERKAIESEVQLDLEAAQEALKIAGEKPLTPAEAKEFWQTEVGFRLFNDDLYTTLRTYQKREQKLAESEHPNLYKKALLDSKIEGQLSGWKSYNRRLDERAGKGSR